MVVVVVEKKVRLGLAIMGVPSSSSIVGEGVMGWELSLWMAGSPVAVSVVLTAWLPEVDERAWKKGDDVLALEGEWWGVMMCCFLGPGVVGVASVRMALRCLCFR